MSIDVTWLKDSEFKVVTENKFEFHVDAENKIAPCPTEILLSALGTCSATDVVAELIEQGVNLKGLRNRVSYTLTEASPKIYKSANLNFIVNADDVTTVQVENAARNAIEKYCHVCLMLKPSIEISYSIEIIDR